MKPANPLMTAALVLGSVVTLWSQDPPTAQSVPTAPEGTAPVSTSTNAAPAEVSSGEPISVFSADTLRRLGISPNARLVGVINDRLDILDKGGVRMKGGIVPLIQQPSIVTFLQLFNPFAPAEYGGMGGGPVGMAFSRATADPVKTQPTAALFSIGDRPVKADTKGSAGGN